MTATINQSGTDSDDESVSLKQLPSQSANGVSRATTIRKRMGWKKRYWKITIEIKEPIITRRTDIVCMVTGM